MFVVIFKRPIDVIHLFFRTGYVAENVLVLYFFVSTDDLRIFFNEKMCV